MRYALLLLALGVAAPASAAQLPALDEAKNLIARGDYAAARALVERWWREAPAASAQETRAARPRALLLRARLSMDPAAAEQDYLALVLGYPAAPEAGEALLRLGQGLLASGEAPRALRYLERLAVDHPNSPDRAAGLLWLARARRAAGRLEAACQAVTQAGAVPGSRAELAALIRNEQVASCRRIAGEARGRASREDTARQAAAPRGRTASQADAAFAAQAGAFRGRQGAETLAAQLRRAGYEPRVVQVPGNGLFRVRIGRFRSVGEAEALVARLRAAGFTALVVRDAARESTVR